MTVTSTVRPAAPAATARPPRPPAAARRGSGRAAEIARRASVVVAILVAWQAASSWGWIDRSTLASPAEVASLFWEQLGDGSLATNTWVSLRRVLIGLFIGGTIGTIAGLVAGLSRVGEELVDTPLQMLRALPFLGLMPLLIVWLGIDESLKIGLVTIGVIFPIYLNLHKGIRAVDPRFGELASMHGLGRWQLIRRVIMPGALPSYLVGVRFALGIAWLSLVVAETVNAEAGIGFLVMRGREYVRTDMIVLGLVIYAVLGLLMEWGVRLLERQLLPWRKEFVG
ncbi:MULTISPECIES: ABC transporter permease [unclassified Aeromicrobium]|uniref:ABC transporter permease n=1 Tax=unclassified Aeromicrobium TaxID=2633570 RepID=UPI00396B2E84